MHTFIVNIYLKLKITKVEIFTQKKFIRNLSKHAPMNSAERLSVYTGKLKWVKLNALR